MSVGSPLVTLLGWLTRIIPRMVMTDRNDLQPTITTVWWFWIVIDQWSAVWWMNWMVADQVFCAAFRPPLSPSLSRFLYIYPVERTFIVWSIIPPRAVDFSLSRNLINSRVWSAGVAMSEWSSVNSRVSTITTHVSPFPLANTIEIFLAKKKSLKALITDSCFRFEQSSSMLDWNFKSKGES